MNRFDIAALSILIAFALFFVIATFFGLERETQKIQATYFERQDRQTTTCYDHGGIPRYSAWDGRYLECTALPE